MCRRPRPGPRGSAAWGPVRPGRRRRREHGDAGEPGGPGAGGALDDVGDRHGALRGDLRRLVAHHGARGVRRTHLVARGVAVRATDGQGALPGGRPRRAARAGASRPSGRCRCRAPGSRRGRRNARWRVVDGDRGDVVGLGQLEHRDVTGGARASLAVRDPVPDEHRVGPQGRAGRDDPQPAPAQHRDLDGVGAQGVDALDHEQAAGGVDVVGEDVDDRRGLAADDGLVGHRRDLARPLGGRPHVDPDGAPGERGVAVLHRVGEEVGAGGAGVDRDRARLEAGVDRGAVGGRDAARELEAGGGRRGVGTGHVVVERAQDDRLAHLATADVGRRRRRRGTDLVGQDVDRAGVPCSRRCRRTRCTRAVRGPASAGAVYRSRPSGVRPTGSSPSLAATTATGSESGSRQSPTTGRLTEPRLATEVTVGLEVGAQRGAPFSAGCADLHGDPRRRAVAAPVVDDVLEGGGARGVGERQLQAWPSGEIATDAGGPRQARDTGDREHAAGGVRVVVEDVEDARASRPGAHGVVTRLRRLRAAVDGRRLVGVVRRRLRGRRGDRPTSRRAAGRCRATTPRRSARR